MTLDLLMNLSRGEDSPEEFVKYLKKKRTVFIVPMRDETYVLASGKQRLLKMSCQQATTAIHNFMSALGDGKTRHWCWLFYEAIKASPEKQPRFPELNRVEQANKLLFKTFQKLNELGCLISERGGAYTIKFDSLQIYDGKTFTNTKEPS